MSAPINPFPARSAHAMWRRRCAHGAWLCLALLAGCRASITHGDRDLPNFQQVSSHLYRGGQPSREGFARLRDMGVKTVVNVRRSDTDAGLVCDLGLDYERRAMSALKPSDEDVLWFLRLVAEPARAPVFLHCHHGADRTGYLVAMERIVLEGWPRERAIAEMTAPGNGFHPMCGCLIDYVRRANIARLRDELGLTPCIGVLPDRSAGVACSLP